MARIKLSKNSNFYIVSLSIMILLGLLIIFLKILNKDIISALTSGLILIIPIIFHRYFKASNVESDGEKLFVSSFFKKDIIPYNNIKCLSLKGPSNRNVIEIDLINKCNFGTKITFIPNKEIKTPANKKIGINIGSGLTITNY